ncbi:MAG: hypothetical protein WD231_04465 [Candidatus Woykebacteria bacterium]
MKRFLVGVAASAAMFASLATPVFANPSSAPGAGDATDIANVATGENPPLGASGTGGLLNNEAGNPAIGSVFAKIIEHNPLCDIHDDSTH